LAGHERDRLVGAIARLHEEVDPGGLGDGGRPRFAPRFAGSLGAEEEELIAAVLDSLAGLAGGVAAAHPPTGDLPASFTVGALGGAEWVMRSHFLDGRPERLGDVVPDFVYLVTLPFVGQEEALRLWRRGQELLGGGADDPGW
jgi:hypothetical protein